MTTAKVKLRSDGSFQEVPITSEDKPKVTEEMKEGWQNIVNLIASFADVRAGLIMEITKESMQVFMMSENESNPYNVGGNDYLCHGLYCESVIGNDSELSVVDARKLEAWKDNPDMDIDMISYHGLPVKWPDGKFSEPFVCLTTNQWISPMKSSVYSENSRPHLKKTWLC